MSSPNQDNKDKSSKDKASPSPATAADHDRVCEEVKQALAKGGKK
jgi:hypothetical protein